ncbi:hypothetical protein BN946_scf185038.g12 [Trametes cinnabarina]|uniref:Uncharacterized protein n=1 Tax=Pycnoporus cinnabarinus TaxID=5643 RepID=A0A060S5S6_PYCCI|nr:hypothetical protein BN946_scf185038.g12 [Trametes cinnabarina]
MSQGFTNELYTGGPEITELCARAERLLANPRFGGDFAERFRTLMLKSNCDRLHNIAFEKLATVRKLHSEARTVRIALRHSATANTLVALDRLFALLDEVEVKSRDDLAAVNAIWARLHPNAGASRDPPPSSLSFARPPITLALLAVSLRLILDTMAKNTRSNRKASQAQVAAPSSQAAPVSANQSSKAPTTNEDLQAEAIAHVEKLFANESEMDWGGYDHQGHAWLILSWLDTMENLGVARATIEGFEDRLAEMLGDLL